MLKLFLYLLLAISLVAWILYFVIVMSNYKKTPHLSKVTSEKPLKNPPLVSIVIPARNEGHRIGECIKTLKSQTYPNLEIIIVDDSTDNTVEVIKTIAKDDKRFKIIKQKKLPNGWVGKPFALQQGSKIATGEWLLFIDADTFYDPVIIERSVEYALRNKLDMLSLAPRHICKSFWEKVIQPIPLGAIVALLPLAKTNDPKSKVALAIGPFIMIKRSTFNELDGYQTIKGYINDDTQLAKLVKSSGFKLGIANAQSMMNLKMYERFSEIWEGWSKNVFLGMIQNRRIKSKSLQLLLLFIIEFILFVLLVFPSLALIIPILIALITRSLLFQYFLIFAALTWIISVISFVFVQISHKIGKARYAPLTLLLGGIIFIMIFLNSGIKTLSGKKVTWKGREYSTKK
ncbi:MAG: glycosyltransferase [Thermoplasmatales archaeon]|nr:glycosyltransferase [Thermoplasmatales archaeon]